MNAILKFSLITLAIFASSFAATAQANVTNPNAKSKLSAKADSTQNKPRPAILKFGKGKCKACVNMKYVMKDVKNTLGNSVEIINYNISTKEGSDKFKFYKGTRIPLTIFLDSSGKEVFRKTGFISKKDIIQKLEKFCNLTPTKDNKNINSKADANQSNSIFETVEVYLNKHAIIAIIAAFIWGILSVVISPCHLASIPLIVGFVASRDHKTNKSAFGVSTLFAIGMFLSIGIIGGAIELLKLVNSGSWISLNSSILTYIIAGLLILVGLNMLSIIPTPFAGKFQVKTKSRGALTAFWLGLTLGIALGPCSLAFMAPILAVVAFGTGGQIALSLVLLGVYGIGHCLVIAIAGGSTKIVQRYLDWNEKSHSATIAKGICGSLVIISAIWIIVSTTL